MINEMSAASTQRAILDAALELVARDGITALSIREVARRAGITHQAPYHYYPNRESILVALALEGFALMREALIAARDAAPPRPDAQFRACGVASFQFAARHTAHFQLMFRTEAHDAGQLELRAASFAAMRVLVDIVIAAQAAGLAPRGDPMAIVITAWSTAHGLSALWVDDALPRVVPMFASDPDRLAALVADTLTMMMLAAAKC